MKWLCQRLMIVATTVIVAASWYASDVVASDNRLQEIKDRGVLRACNLPYPPWNMKNPVTNEWEGINVEIGEEIAGLIGVEIEHVDADFATVVQSVLTDKCDLSIGATWVTPGRAELIGFTKEVAPEGIGVFVHADSEYTSIEELDRAGMVIAAPVGSASHTFVEETFEQADIRSVVGSQMAAALLEVAAGRADAAAGGYWGNLGYIRENPGFKVKPLPGLIFNAAPLAYITPPREYFFRDYLNAALISLEASGRKQAIIEKWSNIEE